MEQLTEGGARGLTERKTSRRRDGEVLRKVGPALETLLEVAWTHGLPFRTRSLRAPDGTTCLMRKFPYACVDLAVRGRAILLGDKNGGFVVPKTGRAERKTSPSPND